MSGVVQNLVTLMADTEEGRAQRELIDSEFGAVASAPEMEEGELGRRLQKIRDEFPPRQVAPPILPQA